MKARIPDPFICSLRTYNLYSVIKWITDCLNEIYSQKEPEIYAVKYETIDLNKPPIIIAAWDLIDIVYQAFLNCPIQSGKTILNRRDFAFLVAQYNTYRNKCEGEMDIIKYPSRRNDFMLFLYGFYGEQNRFQNAHRKIYTFDNYERNQYLIRKTSEVDNTINTFDIIQQEVGVTSENFHSILYFLMAICRKNAYVSLDMEMPDKMRKDMQKVLNYYSSTVEGFKTSPNKRQQLYATPFLKICSTGYVCLNYYLLLFYLKDADYWVIRNHYRKLHSNTFTIAYGKAFENYFEELLKKYLPKGTYVRIPEAKNKKRADWKIEFGKYTVLVEQKSAIAGIAAKQQASSIEDTKKHILQNWIKAVRQLHNTEKDFELDQPIKIVLTYEDYYKCEIFDNLFKLRENDIDNDGRYWLVSIPEMEILLYLYLNDKSVFEKILKEKNDLEIAFSKRGREFSMLFEKNNITSNRHISEMFSERYKNRAIENLKGYYE